MFRITGAAVVALCLAAAPTRAASPEAPAADVFGDPLPPGAVARLGTTRLRCACVALAWAPDGKTFAGSAGDGSVRVWDAASGQELRRFTNQSGWFYRTLLFTADGRFLMVDGLDGSLRFLDVGTGREVRLFRPPQNRPITAAALRPRDGAPMTLSPDGGPAVWDPRTGHVTEPAPNAFPLQPVKALSPDGRLYAGWGPEDEVTVRRADDGKRLFFAMTHLKAVDGLTFSPDGGRLATSSSQSSEIVVWDAATGKELARFGNAGLTPGRPPAFSAAGKYLAGLGKGNVVHIWESATGKDYRLLEPPGGAAGPLYSVGLLAFSPDGKTLAAGLGSRVHLWDVEGGKELCDFVGHNAAVNELRFSPDGRDVLSFDGTGDAALWDAATGKLRVWRARAAPPYILPAAAPDGKTIYFAVADGISARDVADDKADARPVVTGLKMSANGLTPSADGKTLAAACMDGQIHLWDPDTGKERAVVREEGRRLTFALSGDAGLLAVLDLNGQPCLYDVPTGRKRVAWGEGSHAPPAAPTFPNFPPSQLAFTADGRALVTGGNNDLSFLETTTVRERLHIARPGAPINRVALSPDGSLLAVGTTAGDLRLLDAADGWELAAFAGHAGAVTALTFSPDGRRLASGGADGEGLIWDVKAWAGRRRPAAEVAADDLPKLWEKLLDGDASRAYAAVLALAGSARTAAPFLKERLAADAPEERRLAGLIQDLGGDNAAARTKAAEGLRKAEGAAVPALRQALASGPPAELEARLRELIDRHKEVEEVSEDIRRTRAVEALERSGAPEAVEALRALAKDAPGAGLKKQAAAALERLAPPEAAP